MFHRWAALVFVLALCAMTPKYAAGQQSQQSPRGRSAGAFGKPYPNPFNPDVFIPFGIDTSCTEGSQQHTVSIQILNILTQRVAIPVLYVQPTTSTSPTTSAMGAVSNMRLSCGKYLAYWNGKIQGTEKEAPSGTYLVQMVKDGVSSTTKIFYAK